MTGEDSLRSLGVVAPRSTTGSISLRSNLIREFSFALLLLIATSDLPTRRCQVRRKRRQEPCIRS
jgi:hypothetical protein